MSGKRTGFIQDGFPLETRVPAIEGLPGLLERSRRGPGAAAWRSALIVALLRPATLRAVEAKVPLQAALRVTAGPLRAR